ncbi:MAG TPA: hypothetical protein VK988_11990, partial [Acidimicrobiales bacterium]|nr:hypothetical protein [Acidimicrobiales bacterium]
LSARVLPPLITTRPKRGFAAPARLMPKPDPASARGFRQGQYLSGAVALVRQWMATPANAGGT